METDLELLFFDDDIYKLCFRFLHNLFFLTLIVKFALQPNQRDREFTFTAVLLNVMVFFICFTMKKIELSMGMALGLFAIFGVLRYRTDAIRTKDMTYLFVLIGIAVINSLSNKKTSFVELQAVNWIIFAILMFKERLLGHVAAESVAKKVQKQTRHEVIYDRLELLGDEQLALLLEDLRMRTNMDVTRVQIRSIDLATNTALLYMWLGEVGNGGSEENGDSL